MKLEIVIDLSHDAFKPDPGPEVSRILEQLAIRVDSSIELSAGQMGGLIDTNGNKVGSFLVIP